MGRLGQWWTTDPAKRIRVGGADLGEFSITADLYHDDDGTDGYSSGDSPVVISETVRMWLGALNDDDDPYYRADTQGVYFDANWGTTYSSSTTPFAAVMGGTGYGSGFEAALDGTAVPEPATICLLALGGIGVLIRRKRNVPKGRNV